MNDTKKKNHRYSFLIPHTAPERIVFFLFIIEIIALMIFNITHTMNLVNHDSSTMFNQLREIVHQGKLFPTGWTYASSMNLDSTLPLAAIFYKIGFNQFVSFGIANNLEVLLFIFTFFEIFRMQKMGSFSTYLTLFIVFIPFTGGMLGYMSMLFTGAASYGIKVYFIILIIKIWMSFDNKSSFVSQIPWIILGVLIAVIAGISSSIYLLASAILPFYVYLFLKFLLQKDFSVFIKKYAIATYILTFSLMFGVMYNKIFLKITSNADNVHFVSKSNLIDNFNGWLTAPLDLFGGLNGETVTSLAGIKALINTIIIVLLFASLIYSIYKVIKEKKEDVLVLSVLSVFVVNSFILISTYTLYGSKGFEARYLLVSMFPLFLTLGLMLQDIYYAPKEKFLYINRFFLIALIASTTLSSFMSYKNIFAEGPNHQRYSDLASYVESYDPELVYIYADNRYKVEMNTQSAFFEYTPVVRIEATYDNPGYYDGTLETIDFEHTPLDEKLKHGNRYNSYLYLDNSSHPQRSVLIVPTDINYIWDSMPDFYKDHYTYVATEYEYDIYLSTDGDSFDFISGISADVSFDFPYSLFYTHPSAYIDKKTGALVSDGYDGYLLYGPSLNISAGTYSIDLSYHMEEKKGATASWEFVIDENVIASGALDPNSESITSDDINIPEDGVFQVRILTEGQAIEFYSMHYYKK